MSNGGHTARETAVESKSEKDNPGANPLRPYAETQKSRYFPI
jgi:hypothetical protein